MVECIQFYREESLYAAWKDKGAGNDSTYDSFDIYRNLYYKDTQSGNRRVHAYGGLYDFSGGDGSWGENDGALAGGLGGALSDLLSGAAVWVLPTFFIKYAMGGSWDFYWRNHD